MTRLAPSPSAPGEARPVQFAPGAGREEDPAGAGGLLPFMKRLRAGMGGYGWRPLGRWEGRRGRTALVLHAGEVLGRWRQAHGRGEGGFQLGDQAPRAFGSSVGWTHAGGGPGHLPAEAPHLPPDGADLRPGPVRRGPQAGAVGWLARTDSAVVVSGGGVEVHPRTGRVGGVPRPADAWAHLGRGEISP